MKIIKLVFLLLFFTVICPQTTLFGQTEEDIQEFLKMGQEFYTKNDLMGAAIEFENVLMIDRKNFSARVWLAQVYADLKDIEKARNCLREAASQAPDHPRVVQLQKLLGEIKKPVNLKFNDPVINEAMTLIGSGTRLRKYGLVIPEAKVTEDNDERKLLVFEDLVVKEEKLEEKEIDLSFFEDEASPMTPVIKAWENSGLAAGLDKYFEMILDDPNFASQNDKGLVAKGSDFYFSRLKSQSDDLEARYYSGMLSFVNGMYSDADALLFDFRKKPGKFAGALEKAFARIDQWKEAERQRLLAFKRAEAERLALELAEKERLEKLKQKEDVWASLKKNKGIDEAKGSSANAEATKLHDEGYELYKKGKLEEAIEKFESAIAKDANNGKFHYHLGLAWTDKGLGGEGASFDKAITEFQRVISLMPDDKMAKDAQSMIKDIESAKNSLGN